MRTFLITLLVSACFPGPLDVDASSSLSDVEANDLGAEVEDTSGTGDVASADARDSVDAPSDTDPESCTQATDCLWLADDCGSATCSASGQCERIPLTGVDCDDGAPCTASDVCVDGQCRGTPYTCDDALTCTADACDGLGGCLPTLAPDTCFIGGACWSLGDSDP